MSCKLSRAFFARDTKLVARDLVGTYLVRNFESGETSRWLITETEAYLGETDEACHARFGKTERTKVMYKKPGIMYVYLIYGMYDMLNIVTAKEECPEAVLIRGVEGHDGPGKLTRDLNITKKKHNDVELGEKAGVWIERRKEGFDEGKIITKPRIGIDYAGDEWRDKPLRFLRNS